MNFDEVQKRLNLETLYLYESKSVYQCDNCEKYGAIWENNLKLLLK